MGKRIKNIFFFLTAAYLLFLTISISADYANIAGGEGGSGTGTNNNGWVVSTPSGGWEYDGEGLRVYLVSSVTGKPVAGKNVIDITNSNQIPNSGIINGGKTTKYDYNKDNKSFADLKSYTYTTFNITIPKIIPWQTTNTLTRVQEIKDWFLNKNNKIEILRLLDSNLTEVDANGYYLGIEPIAYFRYNGFNFAMTATECALYDIMANNGLFNKMNPLTHWSLPLSMFLEEDEFLDVNGHKTILTVEKWTGITNNKISDNNAIINYLGIGYIHYSEPVIEEPESPIPVEINFSIEAEPKEYEVKGTAGIPVSIGKDAVINVNLKHSEEIRNAWKERLEGVPTVDVYMVLKQAPENRSLTCMTNNAYSGAVLGGTKITLSTSDFINKLLYNTYTFKDTTGTIMINPGETKTYNYTFNMSVKFIESSRYNTGGNIISIDALNPEGSVFDSDYASFFREADPPEYVTYTSTPVAYSEIKQGSIGNEQFEAMAGTPTTRDLYFGAGGSEFIVDFKAEYKKYNTAERTYRVYYSGTECEFKEADNSKTHTLGGVTVNTHTGGSYVAAQVWSGNHGHTQNSANCGTCGATGYNACTVNTTAYNNALTAANAYATQINGTVLTWTAGSDRQTRTKSGWSAVSVTTQNDTASNASAASGGSGCLHGGCSTTSTPTDPHTHSGGNCSAGSPCTNSHAWRIEVRFSVPQDCICGPCCRHDLPALNDTWTQKITYDYFDAVKISVWKIEQGHLNGLGTITGGTNTVLTSIFQGNPTFFYNIANTETSLAGRFRYTLEAGQHDAVLWNLGTRSNKCNKQDETWGTGIKYSIAAYPNQAGYLEANSSAKDKSTPEYAKFKEYREKNVTATVISDFLILQTSSGDQSVLYFQKQSNAVQAQQDFNYVEFTKEEGWNNNSKSAANWAVSAINKGSYNGNYTNTSTKYNGTGSGGTVSTYFDSDPAGTVTRTARPSGRLLIAKRL